MNITITLSHQTLKRLLVLATTVAGLAAASVAWAELPSVFKATDVLTADALNDNFGALDARLGTLEGHASLSQFQSLTQGVSVDRGASANVPGLEIVLPTVPMGQAMDIDAQVVVDNATGDTGSSGASCSLHIVLDGVAGDSVAFVVVGSPGAVGSSGVLSGMKRRGGDKGGALSVRVQLSAADGGAPGARCNAVRGTLRVRPAS